MSEMVERVARAIAASDGYDSWEAAHELTVRKYSDMARAAILALRDPTDEMIGALLLPDMDCARQYRLITAQWQIMIDEAVK